MRRLFALASGVLLGAVLMWVALQYHVLRTNGGLVMTPKRTATLRDSYLDVRSFGVTDWAANPDLVWSLTQNGKTDVLGEANVADTTLKDVLKRIK